MNHLLQKALYCAAWALPTAQAAEPPARPPTAATDASASAPAPAYESAFTGYRRYRGQPFAPWREVNDEVRQTGGHAGAIGGALDKPSAAHPAEHSK